MSAAIKFTCPHCERICKVPAELGGKQGRCPGCRKGLEVPAETPHHLLSGRQTAAVEEEQAPLPSEDVSAKETRADPGAQAASPKARSTGRQALFGKHSTGSHKRRSGRNRRRSSQGEIFFDETGPILCPACKLDVPAGAFECPHCQAELRTQLVKGGLHWSIPLSFLFALPIPVIGLLLAQLGLRRARQRNNYENVAWAAVLLSGANLTFGILYMVNGILTE
ncbi:MAG: hypothetical protein JKY65_03255 [Planctomycetes bacterium]|nr:hypothetical protein [Planctomycetota bacterium]